MKYYNKNVLRQINIVRTTITFPKLRDDIIVRTTRTSTDIVRTTITFPKLREVIIVRTTCNDNYYNVSTKCDVVRTMLKYIGNIPSL